MLKFFVNLAALGSLLVLVYFAMIFSCATIDRCFV